MPVEVHGRSSGFSEDESLALTAKLASRQLLVVYGIAAEKLGLLK